MVYIKNNRFVIQCPVASGCDRPIDRAGIVTILVTGGLLVSGLLISVYPEVPSHLLHTDEFQQWLLEKERINNHIVKTCEKYGETAREKLKRNIKLKQIAKYNDVLIKVNFIVP